MKILFYDCASPFSYDSNTFKTNAIGGTEATIIRVAEALSAFHGVTVAQKYRDTINTLTNVKYVPLDFVYDKSFDVMVCVRKIDDFCKRFKNKVYVLCQNFDEDLVEIGSFLKETNGTLVSVSDHLLEINQKILPDIKHTRIYNPIDDNLTEDESIKRDKNKLVFFSSPHKGFFDTLYVFGLMKTIVPELKLYYSNPGYLVWPHETPTNAINLGSLPFEEIIQHVRESFCVFYINRVFPETFGLIYAEANAVGTPVLTHDFGSAREILHSNNPVLDCNNILSIRDTFMQWYLNESPKVTGVDKFRTSKVVQDWLNLFTSY